jgi:hypothetical protein
VVRHSITTNKEEVMRPSIEFVEKFGYLGVNNPLYIIRYGEYKRPYLRHYGICGTKTVIKNITVLNLLITYESAGDEFELLVDRNSVEHKDSRGYYFADLELAKERLEELTKQWKMDMIEELSK